MLYLQGEKTPPCSLGDGLLPSGLSDYKSICNLSGGNLSCGGGGGRGTYDVAPGDGVGVSDLCSIVAQAVTQLHPPRKYY